MTTQELQLVWNSWIADCEALLLLLHEQTAALTLGQSERAESIRPVVGKLLDALRSKDARAACGIQEISRRFGTEANLNAIVPAIPKDDALALLAMANRVAVGARHIASVTERNRNLAADLERRYDAGAVESATPGAAVVEFPVRSYAGKMIDSAAA